MPVACHTPYLGAWNIQSPNFVFSDAIWLNPAEEENRAFSASTVCEPCIPGRFSPSAAVSCSDCPAGYYDDDSDASTPCGADAGRDGLSKCPAGTHSLVGATSCDDCATGWADLDSNAASECTRCGFGHFTGTINHASAGVSTNGAVMVPETGYWECTECPSGAVDHDQAPETVCIHCAAGQYSAAGAFGAPSSDSTRTAE